MVSTARCLRLFKFLTYDRCYSECWETSTLIGRLEWNYLFAGPSESKFYTIRSLEHRQISRLIQMEENGLLVQAPESKGNMNNSLADSAMRLQALATQVERLTQFEEEVKRGAKTAKQDLMRQTSEEMARFNVLASKIAAAVDSLDVAKKEVGSSVAEMGSNQNNSAAARNASTSGRHRVVANLISSKLHAKTTKADDNKVKADSMEVTRSSNTERVGGAKRKFDDETHMSVSNKKVKEEVLED